MQTKHDTKIQPDNDAQPSLRRRKLLKAALTAPPVVATLHSGAAAATASAYQCATNARTSPPAVLNAKGTAPGAGDKTYSVGGQTYTAFNGDYWARQSIQVVEYTRTDFPTRWFYVSGSDVWEFSWGGAVGNSDGTFTSVAGLPDNYTAGTTYTVYTIVYFNIKADDTDFVSGSFPPSNTTWYPHADGVNVALSGTCLCSLAQC